MELSVVIPAHNEEACLRDTLESLHARLRAEGIEHELVVVDDHSTDGTAKVLEDLEESIPTLVRCDNDGPGGFGLAVRLGLATATGDALAVYMADGSDTPEDLVRFHRTMGERQVDCVFGTRFGPESTVEDYPRLKLILNRLANTFIRILFGISYNDTTNAFKLYSRRAYEGVQPILSHHFNLTVELPLKAIIRGYSYAVLPNDWLNRTSGESKLRIKEMGSRYLFIILYCLIEKWLSRGDYLRKDPTAPPVHPLHDAERLRGAGRADGVVETVEGDDAGTDTRTADIPAG